MLHSEYAKHNKREHSQEHGIVILIQDNQRMHVMPNICSQRPLISLHSNPEGGSGGRAPDALVGLWQGAHKHSN